MTEHHRLDGRSTHYTDVQGHVVAKREDGPGFLAWTLLSAAGLSLVVASFPGANWLVLPGALLALLGVSQSHPYRAYTHWYGLVVAVVALGGPLLHLLALLEIAGPPHGH
ncbi:hypothetical protein [Kocuria sp.]|uniref:hypothetical protein n=1 Tax=Kocuria sp. TaxID=1871328 RepID=UPI0028117EFA|nr:hypothetical protein [Kocuria sp.]